MTRSEELLQFFVAKTLRHKNLVCWRFLSESFNGSDSPVIFEKFFTQLIMNYIIRLTFWLGIVLCLSNFCGGSGSFYISERHQLKVWTDRENDILRGKSGPFKNYQSTSKLRISKIRFRSRLIGCTDAVGTLINWLNWFSKNNFNKPEQAIVFPLKQR